MKCTQCGTEVPDDSQFCTNCGAPLARPAEAVTPPPPEPPPAAAAQAPPPPPPAQAPPPPPGPAVQAPPPAAPPPMAPPAVPGLAPAAPSAGKSRKALWAVIGSLVALLVVAAVVVVLVVFVFGGDDTGKAKDLLTRVDKVMTSVDSTGDSVAEDVENLMVNFVEIETPEDYEEIADGIRADTSKGRTQLEEAQGLYKEILGLDGVEEYKKYANAMLDFIDLDLAQIEEVDLYLDYISEQFELAVSGETVSEQEIADTTEAFLSELSSLSEEAADLKEKAADIRSDNKL